MPQDTMTAFRGGREGEEEGREGGGRGRRAC